LSNDIVLSHIITFNEIKKNLRTVSLRKDPTKHPYKDAKITLTEFSPSELSPGALYVLKEQMMFHIDLRSVFLAKYQIDTLQLTCGLVYRFNERIFTMYPPIVEESVEDNKIIILDGLHRIASALNMQKSITTILVSNVKYVFPCLPVSWECVSFLDQVPKIKRVPRPGYTDTPESYYSLHRDLDRLKLGGSRKTGAKS